MTNYTNKEIDDQLIEIEKEMLFDKNKEQADSFIYKSETSQSSNKNNISVPKNFFERVNVENFINQSSTNSYKSQGKVKKVNTKVDSYKRKIISIGLATLLIFGAAVFKVKQKADSYEANEAQAYQGQEIIIDEADELMGDYQATLELYFQGKATIEDVREAVYNYTNGNANKNMQDYYKNNK